MASSSNQHAAVTDLLTKNCPTLPLRDGTAHPAIAFGTYKVGYLPASASSAATSASTNTPSPSADTVIQQAIQVGYRCFECAEFYGNQAAIGAALARAAIPRDELFLISKIWTTTIEQGPAAVRAQVDLTLEQLQTPYLDLCLIHWPVPTHHVTAYQTLLELQQEGKIKGVGVSNYAWEDYVELKQALDSEQQWPLVNQIEINPFLFRQQTIAKFAADGVVLQSYRSLRDGKAMQDPTLLKLASSYDKSVAQVLGRWCVQHGFVYMPKSVQQSRMYENAAVFDWQLADNDMEILDNKLTTPETLDAFVKLYRKCVNRDTSKDGTMEGVKMEITKD